MVAIMIKIMSCSPLGSELAASKREVGTQGWGRGIVKGRR